MTYYFWKWGMWLRLGSGGFYLGLDKPVLFSERYGYRKVYRLGRIAFEFLGGNK